MPSLAFLLPNRGLGGSSVVFVGLVKEHSQLLLGGGLLLLHQVGVALGDAPAVRCCQ